MEEKIIRCLLATIFEEYGGIDTWAKHLRWMPGQDKLTDAEREEVVAKLTEAAKDFDA